MMAAGWLGRSLLALCACLASSDDIVVTTPALRHFGIRTAARGRIAPGWVELPPPPEQQPRRPLASSSSSAGVPRQPEEAQHQPEQRVTVAIRHQDTKALHAAFKAVSDPRSPRYGQYWSLEQVVEASGCGPAADRVTAWVTGVLARPAGRPLRVERVAGGQLVSFYLTAAEVELLFEVPVRHYIYTFAPAAVAENSDKAANLVSRSRHRHYRRRHRHRQLQRMAQFKAGADDNSGDNTENEDELELPYATRFGVSAEAQYSVPAELAPAIDFVSGLDLPVIRQPHLTPSEVTEVRGLRQARQEVHARKARQLDQQQQQQQQQQTKAKAADAAKAAAAKAAAKKADITEKVNRAGTLSAAMETGASATAAGAGAATAAEGVAGAAAAAGRGGEGTKKIGHNSNDNDNDNGFGDNPPFPAYLGPNVTVVEARDRAFQVHLTLTVREKDRARLCGRRDAAAAGTAGPQQGLASLSSSPTSLLECGNGDSILAGWEAHASPTRHVSLYLPPVDFVVPFQSYQCSQQLVSSDGTPVPELPPHQHQQAEAEDGATATAAAAAAESSAPSSSSSSSAAATAVGRPRIPEGTLALLTCVVVIGPSTQLVNYIPTLVRVRALLSTTDPLQPVARTAWGQYDDYAYPTKSMTVMNVRRLYNVPRDYRATNHTRNSQAVVNFLGISVSAADTAKFHQLMGVPPQPDVTFGGTGDNDPANMVDVEGSIDLQWIQGIGQNVATQYWMTAGGDFGHEPFLDWLVSLSNTSAPALVHSLSYGENEASYTPEYERRCNLELMKLGLRGVSVLVATGDTGVQGAAQQGGAPPTCAPFHPIFPASSPYVTSVGATQFSTHVSPICDVEEVFSMGTGSHMPFACPDDDIGEMTCSTDTGAMITSGGGFSDVFEQPWYQRRAVASYFDRCAEMPSCASGLDTSLFNTTGRAFPDIAAIGQNVPAVFNGTLEMVGGTSAAAPIAAGLVSMLNGELLRLGRPPLGFLNPWLYTLNDIAPDTTTDVRAGNNSGGNRLLPTYVSCGKGFDAIPGWDPATGLGSLNFQRILAHIAPGGEDTSLNQDILPAASPAASPTASPVAAAFSSSSPSPPTAADSDGLGAAEFGLVVALCVVCSLVSALVGAVVAVYVTKRMTTRANGADGATSSLLTYN
eukprot:g1085.t1